MAIFGGQVGHAGEALGGGGGGSGGGGGGGGNGKASTSTEPFHCLNVDVKSGFVKSLDDALTLYAQPEPLENFTLHGAVVSASRTSLLAQLPAVLVLRLKRFFFDHGGAQKVLKHVKYPDVLRLRPQLLAPSLGGERTSYRLCAVISHHGKSLSGGHYTCDVRCPAGDTAAAAVWMHCDDDSISRVALSEVLSRQAYVLFYEQT